MSSMGRSQLIMVDDVMAAAGESGPWLNVKKGRRGC